METMLPVTRPLRPGDEVSVIVGERLTSALRVIEISDDGMQFTGSDFGVYHRRQIRKVILKCTPEEIEFALNNPINTTANQRERLTRIREADRKRPRKPQQQRKAGPNDTLFSRTGPTGP